MSQKKGQNAVHTIFRLACGCDLYELCTQNVCTHKMKGFFFQTLLFFLYKSIIAYLYNHILKPSYIPPSIFVRPTCMYRGRWRGTTWYEWDPWLSANGQRPRQAIGQRWEIVRNVDWCDWQRALFWVSRVVMAYGQSYLRLRIHWLAIITSIVPILFLWGHT